MGTCSDDFFFAKWGLEHKQFRWNTSKRIAEFLVEKAGARGYDNVIAHLNGHDVLGTDLYELLRLAEPDVWHDYCAMEEEKDEWQSRLDNARGKSY